MSWTTADIQLLDPATPPPPVGAVWTVFLDGVGFEYTRKAVSGTSTPESIVNVAAGLADAPIRLLYGDRTPSAFVAALVRLAEQASGVRVVYGIVDNVGVMVPALRTFRTGARSFHLRLPCGPFY